MFTDLSLDWKEIYKTPRIVSSNTHMRGFQCKILNNALFLNKTLFLFIKSNSPLCSFCKDGSETVFHPHFYCPNVRNLWNLLNFYLAEDENLSFHPKRCRLVFLAFPRKTIHSNFQTLRLSF